MLRNLLYRLRGERPFAVVYWPQDYPVGCCCDGYRITRYLVTNDDWFEVLGKQVQS